MELNQLVMKGKARDLVKGRKKLMDYFDLLMAKR
jgi:hypothetical protein